MKTVLGLILCFGLVGCATMPEKFQPALDEPYGTIKAGNGTFIEHVDDKHLGLGIYGYKGDIRVSPGEHVIGMHYDSPGFLAHYSGSKLLLPVNVEEGVRHHIEVEITRKWGVQETWRPTVARKEEIEGYWENKEAFARKSNRGLSENRTGYEGGKGTVE